MKKLSLKDLEEAIDRAESLLGQREADVMRRLLAIMEPSGPFICGGSVHNDSYGLPEFIFVCPSYGLSGTATYKKVSDYSEPGY